jgi:hypothetical protein
MYFSGPGLPEDIEVTTQINDQGFDSFALEPVDDATGSNVSFGALNDSGVGANFVGPGSTLVAATRYRKAITNTGGRSKFYALWIPNGERQAVMLLDYTVENFPTYLGGKRVRGGHMFCGGEEITSGYGTTCCDALGAWVRLKSGSSRIRSQLPAPVAPLRLGQWRYPDGTCPFVHYQEPYICFSDNGTPLISVSRYDTSYSEYDVPARDPEISWSVQLSAVGEESRQIDSGDSEYLTFIWLATPIGGYVDPPLYMNRTYKGAGVVYSMPHPDNSHPIGGVDPAYFNMIKTVNSSSLWVGEPEI